MPEICLVIVVQSAYSHFGAFQVEILQMYYIYIRIIILLMLDVCTFISPATTFIELDDGNIYRKPLYLMVKTMVSYRFSQTNQSIFAVRKISSSSLRRSFSSSPCEDSWRPWCPGSPQKRLATGCDPKF